MPSPEQQNVIEQIHGSGRQLVIALTGGGSGAISALLQTPGASASMLEAVVPYSSRAMRQWLGGPVEQYCSENTARAMAMRAFERARELSDADPGSLIGIGSTASLTTNRPKRGAHRIHVASQSATTTTVCSCLFPNSNQTRPDEEEVSSLLILHVVAKACDITVAPFSKSTSTPVECQTLRAPMAWSELLLGERDSVFVGPQTNEASPQVLFPGAFNPPHQGHERMAEIAAERSGKPVTFELSITNVDKPPLDFIEITNRLEQLADRPAMLTRAPTFIEKSALAPGCVFVVGADTLERIADPRYYGNDPAQRDAAIAQIAGRRCRFLVFGRTHENRFATTSNIEIPPALFQLCDEVPESEFRVDISSTALRSDTMGSRKSAEESEAQ